MLRRIDFRVSLFIAALAVLATAGARSGLGAVDWLVATRDALDDGQLWRLLTGPLVHATWGHLIRDLALMLLVGAAYEGELGRRWWALCAGGLVAPTAIALVSDPALSIFYGTSGLTHAMLAAVIVLETCRARGRFRWLAIAAGILLAGKVVYEVVAGRALFTMDLGEGVVQLPIAHLAGAAVGVALARRWRLESRSRYLASASRIASP